MGGCLATPATAPSEASSKCGCRPVGKNQEDNMKELEKNYNPAEIEDRLYEKWMNKKYFKATVNRSKKPFTIVMPPPNITGQLHMGHALDNTLQDILIRFRRMQGYDTLWLPGTDHASIATEAKIVEAMKKEGITKEDPEMMGITTGSKC